MIGKYKNKKDLIIGLSFYIGGSIFGPLIFFVAGGFLIDKYNGTKPLYTLIGLGIAFVVTNVILFKKSRGIYSYIAEEDNHTQKTKDSPLSASLPEERPPSLSTDDKKENK